jgi:hypothetical protein
LIEQHARFQDPSESVFLHANAGESAGQPVQPAQP